MTTKTGKINSSISHISDAWKECLCTLTISYLGSRMSFFTCSRNWEKVSPTPKAVTSLHSSAHERDAEPLCALFCISDTIMPSATVRTRLSGRIVVGIQVGRDGCFTAGQSVRCGQNTESLSFHNL